MGPTRATLTDGRQHWQHGPIDVAIAVDGDRDAIDASQAAAWSRFATVLDDLVSELPLLRGAVGDACPLRGRIARRMWQACAPHRERFITPMAAVAGAVADELVACYRRPGIRRASINNGGDIALHLAPGASLRIGLFADLARFAGPSATLELDGRFAVAHESPVRGVATSGWRGRSFSLGIADSVTVLARTAADADAAATMIANAVDVDDPRIVRRPASSLKDDSDLGERRVTVDVPRLGADLVREALTRGVRHADMLRRRGVVEAAALVCQGIAMTSVATSREDVASRRVAA